MKEITIYIQTFNHEKFIKKCINSVLRQNNIKNFKILVHDDKSQDGTIKIIQKFKKKNIEIIQNKQNQFKNNFKKKGHSSLLKTLKHIKTKYIAILEGDDYWSDRNKIADQIKILKKNKKLDCVYSNYYMKKHNLKKLVTDKFHISTTIFKVKNLKKLLYPYKNRLVPIPGDFFIKILMDEYGKSYRLNRATTTTNLHSNNIQTNKSVLKINKQGIELVNYLFRFEKFNKTKIFLYYFKYNCYIKLLKNKNFYYITSNIIDFFKTILCIYIYNLKKIH